MLWNFMDKHAATCETCEGRSEQWEFRLKISRISSNIFIIFLTRHNLETYLQKEIEFWINT